MKVITLCLWRRPKYTRQVLNALRACHGIGNYTILAHVDGGPRYWDVQEEVIKEVQKVDFALWHITASRDNLGCNRSTLKALEHGFSLSDYVIHIEDDVQFAPDALQYFEWAYQFQKDSSIFIVSSWQHPNGWTPASGQPKPKDTDRWVGVDGRTWVWGWATWKDRWQEMQQRWIRETNDLVSSWDIHLESVQGKSRYSLAPHTSRSTNIGVEGGIHSSGCLLPYWAGSPNFDAKPACYLAPPTFIRV